jgi:hypothetical protein
VREAKVEISRVQGTRESKQELFKAATRADGRAVREEHDAEPEALDDDAIALWDGEAVAMAVKSGFGPLHTEVERTLEGHTGDVKCLVMNGDKLISRLVSAGQLFRQHDQSMEHQHIHTWTCEHTLEGHEEGVY